MSPPHYVGYDDDPLPPDRFRMSFGPPKRKPRRQPAPEPELPPTPPPPPRPVVVPPRPVVVVAAPPPLMAPVPVAPPPPPRAPRAPAPKAPPRPIRVLRPQLEPRGQQVRSFPTWKPLPAPVVWLPARPTAAVAEAIRSFSGWRVLALRLMAALLLMAPLGWVAGWVALPHSPAEFAMTGLGRQAWGSVGAVKTLALYWVLIFPAALALTFVRSLYWPACGVALLFWSWTGLQHALGVPGPWVPW